MQCVITVNILLIIILYGPFQIQAQSNDLKDEDLKNATVTPGIMMKHNATLGTHMEKHSNIGTMTDAASSNVQQRNNSRGPLKSDTIQNFQSHSHSRAIDIPPFVDERPHMNSNDSDVHTDSDGSGLIDEKLKTEDDHHVFAANAGSDGEEGRLHYLETAHTIIDNGTKEEITSDHNPGELVNAEEGANNMGPPNTPNHTYSLNDHMSKNESEITEETQPIRSNEEENLSSNKQRNDLCSSCLCDPKRLNIYCKHEHLHDGEAHHLTLDSHIIPKTATSLHIEDFETVIIMNGTFSSQHLELRKIQFENIKNMKLMKDSLYFSAKASSNREVVVIFTHCTIQEMPMETLTQYSRSKDQSSDINLEDTRFLTLHIERCNITAIRSYALYQARLLFFKMSYTKVELMEEHSFHVDVYEDWIVQHSHLPMLMQYAISLRTQMIVIFSNNFFTGLENRSLDIISSNQVLFEYNYVAYLGAEALMGIIPTDRGANMVFLNNTVSDLRNRSLIISKRYPLHERKVLDNKFNIICDCNIKERFHPILGITATSDQYENQTFNDVIKSSLCKRYPDLSSYSNIENYIRNNCTPMPIPIIASAATVVTVIVITIIVCIVCTKRAEKAKEEANYLGECCYSHSFSTLNSGNQRVTTPSFSNECGSWERGNNFQPWVVAVPEVKTYQETEVHVHYEHTDPLNASVRGSYHEPIIDFQRKTQVRASCPFN